MGWYRTGTIALTNGSTAVVGTGTDFLTGAAVGEGVLAPDGKIYEIASIQSSVGLTLGSGYLGTNASGQAYAIIPSQSYIRDLASQAAILVNSFQTVKDNAGAGKFGDGTAAAPGISFVTDTDTGIRRVGANSFAFVTGGADRGVLSSTLLALSVGLSATALDATPIGATTRSTGAFTTLSATGNVTVGATGNPTLTLSSTGSYSSIVTLNGAGGGGGYITSAGSGANLRLNAPTGQTVNVEVNNVVVTATSSTGLAVTGALSATGNVNTADAFTYSWGAGTSYVQGSSAGGYVKLATAGGSATLDTSGNLVLGVVPYAGLNFKSFQLNRSILDGGVSDRTTLAQNYARSGGVDTYIGTDYATYYRQISGQHQWFTAPSGTAGNPITFTQAMTLDAFGRFWLNQTGGGLANSNSIALQPLDGYGVFNHLNATASGTRYFYFGYNGGEVGSITQNGTTGVLYNTTSDYRVKNDPVAVVGSGDRIDALQPKRWIWNRDKTPGQGFIAHEFAIVYPDSVQGVKDEMQEVEYEVTPAIPEVLDEAGEVLTPSVPAVTETRTVPKYQSMMAASPEVMADIIAELQSLRARIAQLEASHA